MKQNEERQIIHDFLRIEQLDGSLLTPEAIEHIIRINRYLFHELYDHIMNPPS